MKVVVNLPTTSENISFLEDNIATFRATLILETIKRLKINNKERKLVLNDTINKIKKE